jgi:signal transduction histidine kinase
VPRIQPLNEGRWLLVVKHSEGSVDAVVNRIRRRHLALSFGVLLVLALGMATMIVSTQRARRLAQLQVDFVAGVSHELRTPVAVICSAGENLADGIVHSGPQVVRYGEVVRNEGRRLAGMIEQILVFAARRTGRRYELCEVDISEIVQEVLADADPLIQQNRISAETEIEPRLPAAMADPLALKQCLQNLVANAIKYGGTNRWMAVRARTAGGSERPEIEIRVEDKGIGIEQSDLPYIFEPFYRSRAARDRQIRGFGLGLALAKETVEAMGGRISVTSKPGGGSCFTLHLPPFLS